MIPLSAGILALFVSAPGLEVTETRVNLLGGPGFGGPSLLIEHDWIYLKALLAQAPGRVRPTLGLFGAWIHAQGRTYEPEGELLVLGVSSKFMSMPTHRGADAFFGARVGLAYGLAGDEDIRGFGEGDFDWLDYSMAAGASLGRFHGVLPVVEVYLSPSRFLAGARLGLSLPLRQDFPLPPAPPASASKGPLFHGSLGAVFTGELAGPPLSGEKWFGGQVEAGISLYRTVRRQVILGTRALAAGAEPADAWSGTRRGLRTAALTLAWQDFGNPELGLGYRVTAGGRYYTRYQDEWGDETDLMPVLAVMILVPRRGGWYPFLEIGYFPNNPVVLGVGRSF